MLMSIPSKIGVSNFMGYLKGKSALAIFCKHANPKYNGRYKDASWGDKLRRMNYEIHTGSVLGLPGQLLVFFAALLGASLPLTGFYIFFVKRRNKNKNKKKS